MALTVLQCLDARIGRAGEIDLILRDEAKIVPPADAGQLARAYFRGTMPKTEHPLSDERVLLRPRPEERRSRLARLGDLFRRVGGRGGARPRGSESLRSPR